MRYAVSLRHERLLHVHGYGNLRAVDLRKEPIGQQRRPTQRKHDRQDPHLRAQANHRRAAELHRTESRRRGTWRAGRYGFRREQAGDGRNRRHDQGAAVSGDRGNHPHRYQNS